jgi:FAD/FMN-containing dehydrogenase
MSRSIAGAVFPGSAEDVCTVVKLAAQRGIPIYPVSTGRNWGYGTAHPAVDGCLLVNLRRLNRIVQPPDPVTGLVTIEPGVTQGDLAAYLDREGLPFLVPTTGAGPSVSIVGNALERGHGITPVSDHFLAITALEAVLADGSIYKSPLAALGANGGGQGFRWGVGPYVDGLFSQGGFGVVTKATLALAHRPERVRVFAGGLARGRSLEQLVSAVHRVARALPGVVGGINVMNAHRLLALAAPYPHDALGPDGLIPDELLTRLMRQYRVFPWTVFGTLYGTERIVAAAQKEVRGRLSGIASPLTFIGAQAADRLHRLVRATPILRDRLGRTLSALKASLVLVGGRPNETALPLAYWKSGQPLQPGTAMDPARDGCGLFWYVPVVEIRAESVRRFVDMVSAVMPRHGFEPVITLISTSERCFLSTVPVLFNPASDKEPTAAVDCYRALLDAGAEQGFFPYRIDVHFMDWLMTRAPQHWQVVAKLQASLDPRGVMAPGRYAPVTR